MVPIAMALFTHAVAIFVTASTLAAASSTAQEVLATALRKADLYNWNDAKVHFDTARRLFSKSGDRRNETFAQLGFLRSTMEETRLPDLLSRLTAICRSPYVVADDRLALWCLAIKADVDAELSVVAARETWEEVERIAKRSADSKWANRASGEIGFAAFVTGDIGEAAQRVLSAAATAKASGDIGAIIRMQTGIVTALAYQRQAASGLTELENLEKQLAKVASDAGYQFNVAHAKLHLLKQSQNWTEFERLGDEMLREARQRNRRVKECQTLVSLATAALDRGQDEKALALIRPAMDLAAEGNFPRLLASASRVLARVHAKRGNADRAEQLMREAIDWAKKRGEWYLVPEQLRTAAQLKSAQRQFKEADRLLEEATDIVDLMLATIEDAPSKGFLIDAVSEIYRDQVVLRVAELNNPAGAYAVLERSRGRATAEFLRSAIGRARSAANARARLRATLTPDQIRAIHLSASTAEQRGWSSRLALPLATSTVGLDKVRAQLQPDEIILSYVLTEPNSYCLVVSRSGIRSAKLEGAKRIERAVEAFLREVRAKGTGQEPGAALYRLLLEPAAINKGDRLIIVRDGPLHLVNFEALITPEKKFVVETHHVGYASSASNWSLLKDLPDPMPAKRLIAVGDVPADGANAAQSVLHGSRSPELPALPGSAEEVAAAVEWADRFGTKEKILLTGAKATESSFKKAAARGSSVIHLAVHGIGDGKRPQNLALLLLRDQKTGDDGALLTEEVLKMKARSGLVVLSACDTGVGRVLGQEGIANLSRAFLLSGARTVVSTLWAVDDTASVALMRRFYGKLAMGVPAREALTTAKREMLATFGGTLRPYHWAAYTLEGTSIHFPNQAGSDNVRRIRAARSN